MLLSRGHILVSCIRENEEIKMPSFRDLQKACKIVLKDEEIKLAVLGNASTQFVSQAAEGYAKLNGVNLKVFDAGYNQINVQLLDPNSELYSFLPQQILLIICAEKLYEDFLAIDCNERNQFADVYISKIIHFWDLISMNSNARIIQANFVEINDKVFGHYSSKIESSFIFQLRKLNYLLEKNAAKNNRVFILDLESIQTKMGRPLFFSPKLYYNAKMAISIEALPEVAKGIIDVLFAMKGRMKKCIILDLDNTLWGGVIGDDGLSGIEIGDFGVGHVYTNFQLWLKQLKQYGIILAVCSKNEESIAKEPFLVHDEMVLKLDDISIFVANWDDKASNIKLIQESLNIGMDSIIFLDDNPFERSLVKNAIPDIEVPELPNDPADWLAFIQDQNYFETASFNSNSPDRTKYYQAEFERKKIEHNYVSIDDYLEDLRMIGESKPFDEMKYSRIAQLTQRSNQFNLRTIRYTEDEIQRMANNDSFVTSYFTLKDRLGDYGLVSVVILKKQDEHAAFIDTWLMSCRVLKRGMEEFVMNKLVGLARNMNISTIIGEYLPTQKNKMVANIYEQMGFRRINNNLFELDVKEYKEKKTYIKEI